jgi:hypothetical protein
VIIGCSATSFGDRPTFQRNTRLYLQGSTRRPNKTGEAGKLCYLHGVISQNSLFYIGIAARTTALQVTTAEVFKMVTGVLGGKAFVVLLSLSPSTSVFLAYSSNLKMEAIFSSENLSSLRITRSYNPRNTCLCFGKRFMPSIRETAKRTEENYEILE